MSKENNFKFYMQGLNCANCAGKIENEVKKISGVESASLNFVSKTLLIKIQSSMQIDDIELKIKRIVKNIEPDVVIKRNYDKLSSDKINKYCEDKKCPKCDECDESHEEEEEEGGLKQIIIIAAAFILFCCGIIFKASWQLQLAFCLSSYVLSGYKVVLKALKNITKGRIFDENFLMTLATVGAFGTKQFPEAAAVMLFYKVGEFLEDMAVEHSRKNISDLMNIRPDYANLKIGNEIKKVSPDSVKVGDTIVIKAGEKVPLDGIVLDGNSFADTSALTGESYPREMKKGSHILSGFINKGGLLTVTVEKEFGESTASKILDMVQNAAGKKADTENFITKFARYYTPVVVITALLLAVIPPIFIKGAIFSQWIYRALIFLVVSCPCALVISVPLGFFGGLGKASREGILIKGSNYLEALNDIETIVFDKTGTLTKGVFEVTDIKPENGFEVNELLEYAAYAEIYSNHPVSASIIKKYGKEVRKENIIDNNEIAGKGIKANINFDKEAMQIICGNSKLMHENKIEFNETDSNGTTVYVAVNSKYAGLITISDEIKKDSKETIAKLKSSGIKNIVMLTGDNSLAAKKVSDSLNIEKVYSELLPGDKMDRVEELFKAKSAKGKLVFVGDGTNDAPVLARADIGIAMGALGSDAAIEAADVVLMNDEPSAIIKALKTAKKTRRIVWQNIIFALAVKAIVLVLAAIGLGTIWMAVFADVGVTFIAVINSMRTLK